MTQHKNLVEADLHELKGASTATAGKVPVANGSGSTVFQKITSSSIDTSSIKNTNKFVISAAMESVVGAYIRYVPIPVACTLTRVSASWSTAPSADTSILVQTSAGASMAALSVLQAASIPTYVEDTAIANSTLAAGSTIRIRHADATTIGPIFLVLEFTMS